MEESGVSRASLDALQRVYRPKDYPTREEIEGIRSSGVVWLHPRQRLTRPLRQSERQTECDAATSALEALAHVRLVKYGEWLDIIEELWPKQVKILRQLRLLEKEVKLGVQYCPSNHWKYIRSYDHFLRSRTSDSGATDSGDDVKKSGCADISDLAISVRLVLRSVNYAGQTWHWELWMKACEAVETAHKLFWSDDNRFNNQLGPLYRFVEVEIDLASEFHDWPAVDILTMFRRFAVSGVRVLRQLKPSSEWVRKNVAPRLIPLVQDLTATNATQNQGRERFCAYERLRFWLDSETSLLDSIFSVIIASHSVRQVTASTSFFRTRGDRERAWQWIAVVFRQPIQQLDLDCGHFNLDDVHVLESALRAPNPLSLLFSTTMAPVDETDNAFIASAGCFRLYPPSLDTIESDINESTLLYDSPLENLQVISIDKDWVTVLLPGWGCAWVSHADVSLSTTEQSLGRTGCGPRRLSLTNLQSDQAPVVLALLHQVGEQIQSITLSSFPGNSLSRDKFKTATPFLEVVLLTCPNLEELTVKKMSLPSLSIFTRAYENHSLRVHRLFLEKVELEDRVDSLYFFKSLGDTRHPMANQLRSFSCTFRNRSDYFPNIKPTILLMLQRNKQLDEFQLDPGDAKCTPGPDDTITQDDVDQINGGRLSSRSQLAFLSAVVTQQRDGNERGHAIHSLDRDVLTTIFQFATSTRFVRVEFW